MVDKILHNKCNTEGIRDSIDTFNPIISHYRREHAPMIQYFPSDVSIRAIMYQDFSGKYL